MILEIPETQAYFLLHVLSVYQDTMTDEIDKVTPRIADRLRSQIKDAKELQKIIDNTIESGE